MRAWLMLGFVAAACGSGVAKLESAPPVTLYPTPFYAVQQGRALPIATACVSTDRLAQHATVDARAPQLVKAAGLQLVAPGLGCDYTIAFSGALPYLSTAAQGAWSTTSAFAGAADRYVVIAATRDDPAAASAELYAESEPGALHALTVALGLVDAQRRVRAATIVDGAPIAVRGLVEGYYGTPFSRAQRNCLIETMERLRQNLYLYGPKNDVYARQQWADPYPQALAGDLAAAAATARARLVDFVWSISPGSPEGTMGDGSISFASDEDFARLTGKIDSVRALGIDRFALFLDDTSPSLVYPADQAKFASPVAAHAALANRLDDYVTGGDPDAAHLLFVGYAYTTMNPAWAAYASSLGQALHPGIAVMWTGPQTYSRSMSAADLMAPDALLQRRVLIWDNEPESRTPLTGRGGDLAGSISGYLANPVVIQLGGSFDDWWADFGTIADYDWNPSGYDATRSFSTWKSVGNKPDGC